MTDRSLACRLIIDRPQAGAWNMAVDEYLLDEAINTGQPAVRFYEWDEPTISLGYFQAYADRAQHAASQDCACVRRTTGGGAILHDHELTYSIVWPTSTSVPGPCHATWLYHAIHETLKALLEELALDACIWPSLRSESIGEQPFLCFLRRAEGDLVVGPHKLAGSAQRRKRGAILQHGSVLCKRSVFAPELAGIGDLANQTISAEKLKEVWPERLASRLTLAYDDAPLKDHERCQVRCQLESKFGRADWTNRR